MPASRLLTLARDRRESGRVDIDQLLADQQGVISRRQAIGAGWTAPDIARQLRRREWASTHPGVYVMHTGTLTWSERAWAGILYAAPAVLDGLSALRAAEGEKRSRRHAGEDDVIHVAIRPDRVVTPQPGLRITRRAHLDLRGQWHLAPPRVRYDDAIAQLALDAGEDLDALGRITDAVGARRTTAERLATTLRVRPGSPRRTWLLTVLDDVAAGTGSALEQTYLDRVVRAHGLPIGLLQAPGVTRSGRCRRDVDHPELGIVVELDGVLHHTSTSDRDADLDRDLVAAAEGGRMTLRLGWGQAHVRSCWTAARLQTVFRAAGWTGTATRCGAVSCDVPSG